MVVAAASSLLLTTLGTFGGSASARSEPVGAPAERCAYTPAGGGSPAVERRSPIDRRYDAEPALRTLLGAPTGPETGGGIRHRPYENGRMYWSESTGAREIHGDVLKKYLGSGGHEAFGAPITDECPAEGQGRYNHLSGTAATGVTSVYWRPDLGAHLVSGPVRELWEHASWERGTYGFPTTDTATTSDEAGLFGHFTGGDGFGASIYWSRASGSHGVKGAIRQEWLSMNAEQSLLGYPTSNEYDVPIGKRSDFQGGSITWNASTGEVVVSPR